MKFPSLFTRTPSYQRFNYRPRYYDPVKEEQQEREERIKRELEVENGVTPDPAASTSDYRTRIKGSMQAARKRSKATDEPNVAIMRLAVLLFIALFLVAFLTWGKPAIYALLLFLPVYVYFKFFRK